MIDTVGGPALDRSFAVLRPGGRLVTLSAPSSRARVEEFGVEAVYFVVRTDRAQLREIAELVDGGALRVTIAAIFPPAEGRAAFESGATLDRPPGKTILIVREQPGG